MSKPLEDRKPIIPIIFALLLVIIAAVIFFLSRDSSPTKPNPERPETPETPVEVIPNDPPKVDAKKRQVTARYIKFRSPEGFGLSGSGATSTNELIYLTNKTTKQSAFIRLDQAQADEPIADRVRFAAIGSQVQERDFRGQPSYLLTTRYRNGFVRLTYIAQADGRNYNIGIFGKTKDIKQLKRDLLEIVATIRPSR